MPEKELELEWKSISDNARKKDTGGPKLSAAGDSPANKRMSVERIYQKKTQLEHILLRPDTYIGSVETQTTMMWVMNQEAGVMEQRELTFVPGIYKIFDEILVNAADNKQRDSAMNCIKIDIDTENNRIKVWNNGKGIPVVEHKEEKMYVPTLIFGHLLTSSNYNDFEKKVTGGRNGYGAKLCNIFSNKFTVETSCKSSKKAFKQVWTNNMSKASEPKITDAKDADFTCVTFEPDLTKFKMEKLDKDIEDLFIRRAYDIAAAAKGVKVILNGKRLPVKNFREYIDLYIKDKVDESGTSLKVVHEVVNPRWEIAVCLSSEKGFQQVSFANMIATTKGGRHVDYIVDQISKKLVTVVSKKSGKGAVAVKPFQVKNNLWVFINCLVENPSFDSQTKENMTLQAKMFGSSCELSEKFVGQVTKCGIIEHILNWVKFKALNQLNKKSGTKTNKLKGIPKLDDANDAGTKNSERCTLILTEGDSAKTLAIAGLGVVGRDHYGVFPLRGKMLNVRDANHKQIMDNAEINSIIRILGLQYKNKYSDYDDVKKLRYGKVMIMADQDQDGSHIKGLVINFIHTNWPNLLKHNFLVEFITPIVKVVKNKKELSFYSLPEFDEWKSQTDNWHTYKIKYYKGLGTSTSKEAKEYFSDMARHRIPFRYSGAEDDTSITLAFSKKCIEERKDWLTNWMTARKTRQELGLAQDFLYTKETKRISFTEFVNKELILFSNLDNERSIPSLVDGFKPGQRKVMFACFKRNLVKELKVAQLAGSVAELSAYHHGEASLMGTIVNLAQNYVGSNNLNLLEPIGQFGTRLHGGKDSASPRYIFTCLSELTRHLFHTHDDCVLNHLSDDGAKIEPEWYCPILPMVLINGASGIGTGWSTSVPNFDVNDVAENVKRLISGDELRPMTPSYKGFRGDIDMLESQRYVVSGEVATIDTDTIEISELPVGTWTQSYKESVLEPYLLGTDKVPIQIQDYKEYHTDTTVRFVIKMSPEQYSKAEQQGFHSFFKLQTIVNTTNMVLFDPMGVLKQYTSPITILQEFYDIRLSMYVKRKQYLDGMLDAEARKLSNQARFILEKIDGKIVVENRKKKDIVQTLVQMGFESDPVKAWKESQNKDGSIEDAASDEESVATAGSGAGPDFYYLLNMPILSLTKEKKDELLKQKDAKQKELNTLRGKTEKDLWSEDLDAFLAARKKYEDEKEKAEKRSAEENAAKISKAARFKVTKAETAPSKYGQRVEPPLPTDKMKKVAKPKKEKIDPKQNKLDTFGFSTGGDDDDITEVKASDVKPKANAKTAKSAVKKSTPIKKQDPSDTPKKAKKKNPWDTDSDDELDLDSSGVDSDVVPRERVGARQAATKKPKYKFGDDSEDESADDSGSEKKSSPSPAPKAASREKSPAKKQTKITSDSEDNDILSLSDSDSEVKKKPAVKPSTVKPAEQKPAAKKPAAKKTDAKKPVAKKPAAKKAEPAATKRKAAKEDDKQPKLNFAKVTVKKIAVADSFTIDSSDDEIFEPPKKKFPVKKPAASKPAAKKAPPKKRKQSSSGSDISDLDIPKKKTTAKRGTKANDSDDSLVLDTSLPVAPRQTTARGRKAVKYIEDSDSD